MTCRVPSIFLTILLFTMPASAFSGAEFKDAPVGFATGYGWGVVESWLVSKVGESESEINVKIKRWDCFVNGKINAATIYDATKNNLDIKPELLAQPAFVAVIQTALKICP